jgi:hypothetical protein
LEERSGGELEERRVRMEEEERRSWEMQHAKG